MFKSGFDKHCMEVLSIMQSFDESKSKKDHKSFNKLVEIRSFDNHYFIVWKKLLITFLRLQ